MSDNYFWIGRWMHSMPKKETERFDIINRICFGPLETDILGLMDGKFFREYHYIEGICAGDIEFSFISGAEFLKELEYEIELSIKNNCSEIADALQDIKKELFG